MILVATPSTVSSSTVLSDLEEFRRTCRPTILIVFDESTLKAATWAPETRFAIWIRETTAALQTCDLTGLNPVVNSLDQALLPQFRGAPFRLILVVILFLQTLFAVIALSSYTPLLLNHTRIVLGFATFIGGSVAAATMKRFWEAGKWKAEFMSGQVRNAIANFYSCFLSYSTKDEQFADRLYVNLQENNVRCWYAPNDLRIGDPFRQRIDEAILRHDKLLVVLSRHSVGSDWVREEVESCFERERRQERNILVPIRIDDAIMHTELAWAASIRRQRQIGDFTGWGDKQRYRQAFQKLLHDLNK